MAVSCRRRPLIPGRYASCSVLPQVTSYIIEHNLWRSNPAIQCSFCRNTSRTNIGRGTNRFCRLRHGGDLHRGQIASAVHEIGTFSMYEVYTSCPLEKYGPAWQPVVCGCGPSFIQSLGDGIVGLPLPWRSGLGSHERETSTHDDRGFFPAFFFLSRRLSHLFGAISSAISLRVRSPKKQRRIYTAFSGLAGRFFSFHPWENH